MSHTPHELHEEFPDHLQQLHALKVSNAHFSKLADEYHEVNRAVHRGETDIEPLSDQKMSEIRKQRMTLKDQIWSLLNA